MPSASSRKPRLPQPSEIKNFPDDPAMKVFESNGTLYGGYRIRKRDPITHKQHEQKVYSGRIVDGIYYTMDEFKERFTRTGEPRQSGAVLPQGLTPAAEEAVRKKADQNQKLLADIAGVLEDFDGTLGDGVADEEPKKAPALKKGRKSAAAASDTAQARPRAFGRFTPGEKNDLTDVSGVTVKHYTFEADKGKTGCGLTMVGFEGREVKAAFVRFGEVRAWGLEALAESHRIKGSVVMTSQTAFQKVLALLPDTEKDVLLAQPVEGVNLEMLPADLSGARFTVKDGALGAGVGLEAFGFAGGVGSSSRTAVRGYKVAVMALAACEGMLQAVETGKTEAPQGAGGSVLLLTVTDAPLSVTALTRLARASVAGLFRTGAMPFAVTSLALTTDTGEVNDTAAGTVMLAAADAALEAVVRSFRS